MKCTSEKTSSRFENIGSAVFLPPSDLDRSSTPTRSTPDPHAAACQWCREPPGPRGWSLAASTRRPLSDVASASPPQSLSKLRRCIFSSLCPFYSPSLLLPPLSPTQTETLLHLQKGGGFPGPLKKGGIPPFQKRMRAESVNRRRRQRAERGGRRQPNQTIEIIHQHIAQTVAAATTVATAAAATTAAAAAAASATAAAVMESVFMKCSYLAPQ